MINCPQNFDNGILFIWWAEQQLDYLWLKPDTQNTFQTKFQNKNTAEKLIETVGHFIHSESDPKIELKFL